MRGAKNAVKPRVVIAGGAFAARCAAVLRDMFGDSVNGICRNKGKFGSGICPEPGKFRDGLSVEFAGELAPDPESGGLADILIVNSEGDVPRFGALRQGGVIVANSDEKGLIGAIGELGYSGSTVVTYGLNGRACVTVSSVSERSVVLCVQRSLPTLGGSLLEQQEFAVPLPEGRDIYGALAANTAALLIGR
ncbi:MAG: hypothetical protein LBK41_06375 [Clostridiales bacterium]|jgi:hypothetical protein|nr:hypothetical protein [Clostridiales bacterium]